MTYDQLEILEAIIEQGGVHQASEFLHKSQPAITQAMKNLEERLDFKILDRTSYRLRLTEEGQHFYQQMKSTLQSYRELKLLSQGLAHKQEIEVSLSIDAVCPTEFYSALLQKFYSKFPQVNLNLSLDILDGGMEKIKSKSVQFSLGLWQESEGTQAIKVDEMRMVPVISKKLINKVKTLKDLKGFPQLIVKSSAKNNSLSLGILDQGKKWSLTDQAKKKEFIELGLGWGRIPECEINSKLSRLNFKEVPSMVHNIFFIRHEQSIKGQASSFLWDYFRQRNS